MIRLKFWEAVCHAAVVRGQTIARYAESIFRFTKRQAKETWLCMQDKIQMHLDRMYLLLQRLRRNKNFSRPAFAGLKASSRGFIEVL